MPKFITNIDLQDGNQVDYDRLQTELKKESFIWATNLAKSTSFVCGQGIFFREGITIQEVTAAVIRATYRTGKKYSFFVLKEKLVTNSNL